MKRKKKDVIDQNFLEFVPVRSDALTWKADDKGIVTLTIENTGLMNRICQKIFLKPEHTYIHLDKLGSFIWPLIDGKKSILELGDPVKEHFGEDAEPLYPRLAKFFQILESYHFISLNKTK